MGSGNKIQTQKKGPLVLGRERGKGSVPAGKRREMGKVPVWEQLAGCSVPRAFKGGDVRGGPRGAS